MDTMLVFGGEDAELIALRSLLEANALDLDVQPWVRWPKAAEAGEKGNAVLGLIYLGERVTEDALPQIRQTWPELPFLVIGNEPDRATAERWIRGGAEDYLNREDRWRVIPAARRALRAAAVKRLQQGNEIRERQVARLLAAVQALALAKTLSALQAIVSKAARDLTGADGATLILKEADQCYYADEDAIAPLWKGQRFPTHDCIGGWVMAHKKPAVIEDVYQDTRISPEAYRSTFVKSLIVVPIRAEDPVGAIGSYWREPSRGSSGDVGLLQTLAAIAASALEKISVYAEFEKQIKDRTRLLELTNRELESFSYSISHDLRSPITAIMGFAQILSETIEDGPKEEVRGFCDRIIHHTQRMSGLIRDLQRLAKFAQTEPKFQNVDLSDLATRTFVRYRENEPHRQIRVTVAEKLTAYADPELVEVVLENLLSNAWKYTGEKPEPAIEFGRSHDPENEIIFYVRDNGVGFDPRDAKRLFAPFQRLHDEKQFAGGGVGLAAVQRIVHKHGGRVWAEGEAGKGATFYFTLPKATVSLDCSQAA